MCTLVSSLLKGAEFTLSVAKNAALFETVRVAPESDAHFNSCSTEGEREDISSRKKKLHKKQEKKEANKMATVAQVTMTTIA